MNSTKTTSLLFLLLLGAGACASKSTSSVHEESGSEQVAEPVGATEPVAKSLETKTPGAEAASADKFEVADFFGQFIHKHKVEVNCDESEPCIEEVRDTLSIAKGPGDALLVDFELMGSDDHSCSFQGELKKIEETLWSFTQADPAEKACLLEFRFQKDQVAISSDSCREHCGAYASMYGTFKQNSKAEAGE
jgi:hypothetical protein